MQNTRFQALIEEAVSGSGTHLIDVVIRGDKSRPVIEVYIDTEAGVTTELCADVSRLVAEKLDADGSAGENYRLEVSSPGIERPLRFPWQYRKHTGRQLEILTGPEGDAKKLTGILVAVDDEALTLRDKKSGNEERTLFADIRQAMVKAPW